MIPGSAEDGGVRYKAEIAPQLQTQRKTTFCSFCSDSPQGFHGDHELRRHLERHHMSRCRVWVCIDISPDCGFLANCKACRNNKTYSAPYNAAAHLRRAHFNPYKKKNGGRNKKSENRGGMDIDNQPPMEVLKNWMYETYELNMDGSGVIEQMMLDRTFQDVPMAELSQYSPQGKDDGDETEADYNYAQQVHAYDKPTSSEVFYPQNISQTDERDSSYSDQAPASYLPDVALNPTRTGPFIRRGRLFDLPMILNGVEVLTVPDTRAQVNAISLATLQRIGGSLVTH